MQNKIKRPVSVWIAQFFFVFFILVIVLAFFLAMLITPQADRSFAGVLWIVIIDLVFIGLFVIAFWGMATRKVYGRWLGVAVLSFMLIFVNISTILFPSNSTEPLISTVIRVLFSIFLFIVTLHVALSDNVEVFFARKIDSSRFDNPPPPPSFDD